MAYHVTPQDQDFAHKGYLVRFNPVTNTIWIEKDRHMISYTQSAGHAIEIIDTVLTEEDSK